MRVSLHHEVHVDLDGLELFAVVDVPILRELLRDIFETICEHAATLVSLRELLLRRGIGMVSEVSKLVRSVGRAHDGRLRGTHCHNVGGKDHEAKFGLGTCARVCRSCRVWTALLVFVEDWESRK